MNGRFCIAVRSARMTEIGAPGIAEIRGRDADIPAGSRLMLEA